MAEILVRSVDNSNTDPAKAPGLWLSGHVAEIRLDGGLACNEFDIHMSGMATDWGLMVDRDIWDSKSTAELIEHFERVRTRKKVLPDGTAIDEQYQLDPARAERLRTEIAERPGWEDDFNILHVPGLPSEWRRLRAEDYELYGKFDPVGASGDVTVLSAYKRGQKIRDLSVSEEILLSPRTEEFPEGIEIRGGSGQPVPFSARVQPFARRLWRLDISGLDWRANLTAGQLRERVAPRFDGVLY